MSRLDELINEYCPDGVEYKPLWSLTMWDKKFNGLDKSLQPKVDKYKYLLAAEAKELVEPTGEVYILTTGTNDKKEYTTIEKSGDYMHEGEIIAIPWGGMPNVKYYKGKFVTLDNRIATSIDTNVLSNKFMYYWMQANIKEISSFYRGAGIQHPSMKSVLTMQIPVPPLPVQEEIVRILDNFTELTTELTAELTARKKQYEHYRDELLTFDSVEYKTLGEIANDIYRGNGITREQVTTRGIPCVRYGEIYTTYGVHFSSCVSHTDETKISNAKYFEHGDILFAITGESVEEIAKSCAYVGHEKCLAGGDIVVLKHNLNPKYLAYALSTENAQQQKSKGKIKSKVVHSSVPAIKEIKIPVPPIAEQQRIVDILDRFDKLCSDISEGLPAEIEARQKQYEYYRDKLLTFKEKKSA